jgi:hypothetical protein
MIILALVSAVEFMFMLPAFMIVNSVHEDLPALFHKRHLNKAAPLEKYWIPMLPMLNALFECVGPSRCDI